MAKPSVARGIGYAFAHVQHVVDKAFTLGFRALKNAGQKKEKVVDPEEHPALRKAKRGGKAVLGFLGNAGDAFYERYEELKRKRTT